MKIWKKKNSTLLEFWSTVASIHKRYSALRLHFQSHVNPNFNFFYFLSFSSFLWFIYGCFCFINVLIPLMNWFDHLLVSIFIKILLNYCFSSKIVICDFLHVKLCFSCISLYYLIFSIIYIFYRYVGSLPQRCSSQTCVSQSLNVSDFYLLVFVVFNNKYIF